MTRPEHPHQTYADLSYPLRWRVQSVLYGVHRASGHDDSGHFRGFEPFSRQPDFRRLDLRRSLRDPFGQWYVKDYEPRTPVQIYLMVDVSGSMQTGSQQRHADIAAEVAGLIAHAAWRNGDSLSMFACGAQIEFRYAASGQRARASSAHDIQQWLQKAGIRANSAHGLLDAANRLRQRRSLVFLISDFMFPLRDAQRLLTRIQHHDVVPIALDVLNTQALSTMRGLTRWHDAETGHEQLLFMRPSVVRRWESQQRERQRRIDRLLLHYGWKPFRPGKQLRAEALGRYLMER